MSVAIGYVLAAHDGLGKQALKDFISVGSLATGEKSQERLSKEIPSPVRNFRKLVCRFRLNSMHHRRPQIIGFLDALEELQAISRRRAEKVRDRQRGPKPLLALSVG